MRENYTLTRLYIEGSLAPGIEIDVPKDQVHYLATVLRMKAGDSLRLFNGRDGEWQAEVISIAKRAARLRVTAQLRPPLKAPDIWLCFAPIRKQRSVFIMEKATELGVSVFQPVVTQRTQYGAAKMDKARAQIIEAAEQTERLCLPEVKESQSLKNLLRDWDAGRTLIMADEAGGCPPALTALKDINGPAALLIGPEGGFTPKEREILLARDFVKPVSLGPRILRADTAALSLLTLWQAVCGDWG